MGYIRTRGFIPLKLKNIYKYTLVHGGMKPAKLPTIMPSNRIVRDPGVHGKDASRMCPGQDSLYQAKKPCNGETCAISGPRRYLHDPYSLNSANLNPMAQYFLPYPLLNHASLNSGNLNPMAAPPSSTFYPTSFSTTLP